MYSETMTHAQIVAEIERLNITAEQNKQSAIEEWKALSVEFGISETEIVTIGPMQETTQETTE